MTAERSPTPDALSSDQPEALLRALVLCDLVDSTALVERLGDQTATELIRRHDRMARDIMQRHGGREIDKTDGFLILFDRPIEAVAFALEYQRELRALAEETKEPLSARVGIHVGDVMMWDNAPADVARGAKSIEVEGLTKPVAARLMALARPGQILMSGVAQALTQRGEGELRAGAGNVRWVAHGRYHLKGLPDPIAVFEVGEVGIAPMRAPPASAKSWPAKPMWRRPISVGAAALVLLVAGTVSVYMSMHSEPALAFKERDWLIIGDLVNINADKSFDAPLGAAFRIGIEESHFVNVVPDLAMRQALARMQRGAETRIDREVASEIALREQARAVIVPSIAQYGSKLRLAAELIDPNGGRTVSTHTADADGPNDVLPAMDRLLQRVRSRLGESLSQIQSTSQPLQRVTTPNLEALRAFARAGDVEREGDFDQSARLYKYATELDAGFAMAYGRLGAVLFAQERYAEARLALESALTIEGRLSERERAYVRGLVALYADPQEMLDSWRMYASLYPDQNSGQHNVGSTFYYLLLDYPNAEAALARAAALHSPLRNFTLQTLAHVLLAQEKVDPAEQQFRAAETLAPSPALFGLSDALVAGGKLDEATRYLEETKRQPPYFEVEREMRRATLLIARGEIDAAAAAVAAALPEAAKQSAPNARWRAENAIVALRLAQNDVAGARDLARRVLAETSSIAARPYVNLSSMEQTLYAASWAARLGLIKEAREALALAKQHGALDRFPVRARLAVLVEAELDLSAGHPDAAAQRLQSAASDNGLWEIHEARARALRALGHGAGELAELRWLVGHRGLAYAQWIDQLLGQQARALALRDAEARLSASLRRAAADAVIASSRY